MARNIKNIMRLIDTANNELPIEKQFLQDLEYSIEKTENSSDYIPSKTYKPSSLKCIRNAYFQIVGEVPNKSNTTSSLIGICESGTDRHLRIQKAIDNMKNNNIDCEYIDVAQFIKDRNIQDVEVVEQKEMETKLYNPKLNMSFLCDGIIKYKSKYFILEIKTESANKFMKRQAEDESHYDQATAYSINLGLDNVMFLYENRDLCLKKTYIHHVTEEAKEELIGRIEMCDECVKQLNPPAKPTNISKSTCTYCAYVDKCKEYMY